MMFNHTSYLPFLLHRQDFRKPNFTPQKTTKGTKTLKMSLKKSNICIFFTQSGKIYTWQKFFTQTCLWCLWQIWGMVKHHSGIKAYCYFHWLLKTPAIFKPSKLNWMYQGARSRLKPICGQVIYDHIIGHIHEWLTFCDWLQNSWIVLGIIICSTSHWK